MILESIFILKYIFFEKTNIGIRQILENTFKNMKNHL